MLRSGPDACALTAHLLRRFAVAEAQAIADQLACREQSTTTSCSPSQRARACRALVAIESHALAKKNAPPRRIAARPRSDCSGAEPSKPQRAQGTAPETATTISGGVLRAYDSLLKRRPLPTKMASSGTASGVGDLLAQTIVGNTYDPRRTLVFAAIGVFYFAPLLHLWYKALHKLEKSGVSSGRFTRRQIIFLQLLMNQSIGAMCANGGFFAPRRLRPVAAGGANAPILETASRAFHRKFWRIMKANWVVWPLPSFVNLALVPLDYRVLFMDASRSCGSACCRC